MLIEKTIEVGIDIRDPISVFADPDNLKRILVDRYEKRCFRGCYIVTINKILRQSECVINRDGPPDFGTISVVILVSAIIYAPGEIINGCVVKNKDKSNILICSTDIASIMVMSNNTLDSVANGQTISVRVANVKYNQGAEKVSVSAVPFILQTKAVVYKLVPEPETQLAAGEEARKLLSNELSESRMVKEINPKAWDTFSKLLYAWKEPQRSPPGAKVHNLTDLFNEYCLGKLQDVIYIVVDPRINMADLDVYVYSDEPTDDMLGPDTIRRYELTSSGVMAAIRFERANHIRTIKEYVNIYSTEEMINKHRNIWQIFNKAKLTN